MTDLPASGRPVPGRLGSTARLDGDELVIGLRPTEEVLCHGVVRASVIAFIIDAVAGIAVDTDPDAWSLTTDLSMRMRPRPAPSRLEGRSRVIRRGGRSVTCVADVVDDRGDLLATSALGFTRIPRRAEDPPKPNVTPSAAVGLFDGRADLARPLRDEAGIEVLDAAAGEVRVAATVELRNAAGTMQGAMVALMAEAAAEDLAASRSPAPMVVTELDVRYVARTSDGPVRTRCTTLGEEADAPIRVELIDESADRITSVVLARAQAIDA